MDDCKIISSGGKREWLDTVCENCQASIRAIPQKIVILRHVSEPGAVCGYCGSVSAGTEET